MRAVSQRGVTLVDALVGSALMLIVFVGVAAVFQLSVDVVINNKARAGAIALANERMEYLKSLTYPQIGVTGGIPAGNVPQIETVQQNGVTYTRRTSVYYSDDAKDGLGAADQNGIIADFKTIRVEVSWEANEGSRSIELSGRVSPYGIETAVPGGTLTINVVHASNAPLSNALVQIVNASTSPIINLTSYTGEDGSITFIGAPAASNYQITVTRTGYSTAQTYAATTQNPNPTPRHLTVVNNQTTASTFAIDVLASKTINTFKQVELRTWTDPFNSSTQIATSSNVRVSGGEVKLSQNASSTYETSGFVESTALTPTILAKWVHVRWMDARPDQTSIVYRVHDVTSGTSVLIPDSVLPGNSAGFTTSPIDLTSVSTSTYRSLALRATFSTLDTATSSSLSSWDIAYNYGPEPLPNFTFTMRGNKTIGNSPTVYKYNSYLTSNASSQVSIPAIEWDTYTIGVTATSTYEIAESCYPQSETLNPGASQTTSIYLAPATSHSLLVDVRGSGSSLVDDATVAINRTGWSATSTTSMCGQSYFGNVTNTTYTVTVTKAGYQPYTNTNVSVNGDTKLSVDLTSL